MRARRLVSNGLMLGELLRPLSDLALGVARPEEPAPAEPAGAQVPPIRRSFARLGLDMDIPPGEVTAAYRDLARRYHPERFSEMPSEVQATAERHRAEIDEAYREVQRYQQGGAAPGSAGPHDS